MNTITVSCFCTGQGQGRTGNVEQSTGRERRGEERRGAGEQVGERELRRRAMFTTVLLVAQRREWAENSFPHEWILEDIPTYTIIPNKKYDIWYRDEVK
jgi:hypothetical protein